MSLLVYTLPSHPQATKVREVGRQVDFFGRMVTDDELGMVTSVVVVDLRE